MTAAVPAIPGSGRLAPVRLGPVTLVVSDLQRALAFYAGLVGLWMHRVDDGSAVLGAGDEDLLVLIEDRAGRPALDCSGLFHIAVLVPTRRDLAHALQRIINARMPL